MKNQLERKDELLKVQSRELNQLRQNMEDFISEQSRAGAGTGTVGMATASKNAMAAGNEGLETLMYEMKEKISML